jgi:hypothetical protein
MFKLDLLAARTNVKVTRSKSLPIDTVFVGRTLIFLVLLVTALVERAAVSGRSSAALIGNGAELAADRK